MTRNSRRSVSALCIILYGYCMPIRECGSRSPINAVVNINYPPLRQSAVGNHAPHHRCKRYSKRVRTHRFPAWCCYRGSPATTLLDDCSLNLLAENIRTLTTFTLLTRNRLGSLQTVQRRGPAERVALGHQKVIFRPPCELVGEHGDVRVVTECVRGSWCHQVGETQLKREFNHEIIGPGTSQHVRFPYLAHASIWHRVIEARPAVAQSFQDGYRLLRLRYPSRRCHRLAPAAACIVNASLWPPTVESSEKEWRYRPNFWGEKMEWIKLPAVACIIPKIDATQQRAACFTEIKIQFRSDSVRHE